MQKKKIANTKISSEKSTQSSTKKEDYKKTIEHHKQAVAHHLEAAKHHTNAVKYYEAGNIEKAMHSSLLAYGHHTIAGEFISDDAKYHAKILKQTNYQ